MTLITVDIESFYSQDYSLSRMSEVQYVMDPGFETILASVKVGAGATEVFIGHDEVARRFAEIDWENSALLSHSVRFDGAILAWRFGHVPKLYLDTLSMSRATTHWTIGRSSLAKVAQYLGLPAKGDEVIRAKGKRLADFSPDELAAYAAYCVRDNELCYAIFQKMRRCFRASEIALIDLVARMFILPQVKLNEGILDLHLAEVLHEKARVAAVVAEIPKETFSSNAKFAELLRQNGVEVPMKTSPTTGKEIPALAKGDWQFKELCQDDELPALVQALLAARVSVKSTLEETRSRNLLALSRTEWPGQGAGWAPIPLKYFGARTGRLSGDGGANWQNLMRGSLIRTAIEAPEGYRIVHRDASQIEARMLAWMARCDYLLDAFAEGRDVYSEFASIVYHRQITKADKLERFVGKTCLAAGTRILTRRGPVPIEQVATTDLLWDGVEWVHHDGLIAQGLREIMTLSGVSLTPSHRVLSGTGMKPIGSLVKRGSTRFPRSVLKAGSSPSLATCSTATADSRRSWFVATAGALSTPWIGQIFKCFAAPAAARAGRRRQLRSSTGLTPRRCLTTRTALDYSTGWLRRLLGVIQNQTGITSTTAYAGFTSTQSGSRTGPLSYATSRPYRVGTTQSSRWIASTIMGTTRRAISGLLRVVPTSGTRGPSPTSKRASASLKIVYDLANAGPRHRFTILSNDGPVIVSNCILGLGYGTGAERLRQTLFIGNGGVSVKVDEAWAQDIVYAYRDTFPEIPRLWSFAESAMRRIVGFNHRVRRPYNASYPFYAHIPVELDFDSIVLPNDLRICYPDIREGEYDQLRNRCEIVYTDPHSSTPRKIFGAKLVENVSQALSRIHLTDIAVRMQHLTGYRPFLSCHDALDYCVPASEAAAINAELARQFAQVPAWGEWLPLASEGGWGVSLAAAERRENS